MAQSWKTVRIFISSTFRDMHAERDHLVKVVFPELRERMAGRHLYLVDIDLRHRTSSFLLVSLRICDEPSAGTRRSSRVHTEDG